MGLWCLLWTRPIRTSRWPSSLSNVVIWYVGVGAYESVGECWMLLVCGCAVALTSTPPSPQISRFVEKEVMNLRRLNHYHIISFRRVFVTNKYLGIVTEYANMGNLHEYIRDLGRGLDEQEARWYFQQLTMAIDYCHRMVRVYGCWCYGW